MYDYDYTDAEIDEMIDTLEACGKVIRKLQAEVEKLKGICLRESMVLEEALKRKDNKSMIRVVIDSLADQALQGKKVEK